MSWFSKPVVIPPAPERLPDADEKYRLLKVGTRMERMPNGGDVVCVAFPNTWQLQRYQEPHLTAYTYGPPVWGGNNWYKVCDIVGKEKALNALKIFKSEEEILYWP